MCRPIGDLLGLAIKVTITKKLQDIKAIEEVLGLAQMVEEQGEQFILTKEMFPLGLSRFAEEFGVNNYLRLFLKLNYEYVKSNRAQDQNKLFRDRAQVMRDIRVQVIQELKFIKAENDKQLEDFAKDCYGIIDAVYEASDMVVYMTDKGKAKMIEIRLHEYQRIDRYFKILTEPRDEMKRMLSICNGLIKHQGLARISFDDKMICPFCAIIVDKLEIFKHPCAASVDLSIFKGRSQ